MASPGRERKVTDEEILEVFRQATDPVLTSTEVAEKLDLQRRGTYDRLMNLTGEGHLETKKVGKGAVWWHPESLRERYSNTE